MLRLNLVHSVAFVRRCHGYVVSEVVLTCEVELPPIHITTFVYTAHEGVDDEAVNGSTSLFNIFILTCC
jgi:hypothetical protein